jgi:hypothetical protein
MRRIPVGDTISKAYGFAFSNFLSIFGIAWLPYLAAGLVVAGLVFRVAPDLPQDLMQGNLDPFVMLRLAPIFGLVGILLFFVDCMVIAGVQNKALGHRPRPVFIYFSLGAPVWRMVAAFFLAWLVIAVIGGLTIAATAVIWSAVWRLNPPYLAIVRVLAILAAACWFVYMCVRLTFLLPAVVVAEKRVGLGRAWELGSGNFWRIFVVVIAVFLPVVIGFTILESALFGASLTMPWNLRPEMNMHELAGRVLRQLGLAVIIVQIVQRILFLGLGNGMIANAYQALVQPVPEPAK